MSVETSYEADLSLIIPCYNEESSLEKIVKITLLLENKGLKLELVIVDDCSKDNSFEIAKKLQKEYSNVKVFAHRKNLGKGAALRTGFMHATGKYVAIQDADMETCYKLFKCEVIQEIAKHLKENRFGFEPEITALVSQGNYSVYECAIHYTPRTYEEGKKIGWKDGVRALYCVFHYSAHTAPVPMQLIIYFFIGAFSAIANLIAFARL